MTPEWERFKQDVSEWIAPDELEQWATVVTTELFNVRAWLLKLDAKYGHGHQMGRALQWLGNYRDNTGAHHKATWNIVVATVRFSFEGGEPNLTEEQIAEYREDYLRPGQDRSGMSAADTFLNSVSAARSAEELRAMLRYGKKVRNDPPLTLAGKPTGVEARKWLRSNANPSALATNRFGPTAAAIEFVDALYAAGAKKVMVEDIDDTVDAEGGYADSLKVYLPKSAKKRKEIFRVINDIGRPETDGGPVVDDDEPTVGLWWD